MKKSRILCLTLALAMSASAIPALAETETPTVTSADDVTNSADGGDPIGSAGTDADTKVEEVAVKTVTKVAPGAIYETLRDQANASLDSMQTVYTTTSNDDVADVVKSAGDAYYDVLDEVTTALALVADIDEDKTIPYSKDATEIVPRWDHDLKGKAVSVSKTNKSVTIRYISGGTLRQDILQDNNIKAFNDTLNNKLLDTEDMRVLNGNYYVEIIFNRDSNRLTVTYGTKDNSYDLGGVEMVYRGKDSIFLQQFYPVERQRELDMDNPFLATRILQQENRVRISQEYLEKSDIGTIRLAGGYPSWSAFAFKDYTYDFDLEQDNFKVFDVDQETILLNS